MSRFITYIYLYEKQTKSKNQGFIRCDVREDTMALDLRISGLGKYVGSCPVELLLQRDPAECDLSDPNPSGSDPQQIRIRTLVIGTIEILRGLGVRQFVMDPRDLMGSGYGGEAIVGVRILLGDEMILGSCWKDAYASLICGEYEEVGEDAPPEDAELPEDAEAPENVEAPESAELPENAEESKAAQYRRIEITDIKSLPKRNWYLCNNSFLIHGFFNYHYLMLKTVVEDGWEKTYLGVPGIYEKPEKAMALLFGFPSFQPEEGDEDAAGDQDLTGRFGYWYCLLDV